MFVVLLVMAPSYLEVGASGKPGAVHTQPTAASPSTPQVAPLPTKPPRQTIPSAEHPQPAIAVLRQSEPDLPNNTDFGESPCAAATRGMGMHVTARLYPVYQADEFKYFDVGDNSSWIKSLQEGSETEKHEFITRSKSDAWAIFDVRERGAQKPFRGKYVFGDLRSGACSSFDDFRGEMGAIDLPPLAIRTFLEGLGGKAEGDDANVWRVALMNLLSREDSPRRQRSLFQALFSRQADDSIYFPESDVVNWDAVPGEVKASLQGWTNYCQSDGSSAEFDDADLITHVDIDGDGDKDFILVGDGMACVRNGEVVSRNGGNGGTTLEIFMVTTKGIYKVFEDFLQGATITQHGDFAVLDVGKSQNSSGFLRLKGGRATPLKRVPKGGKTVYELSR